MDYYPGDLKAVMDRDPAIIDEEDAKKYHTGFRAVCMYRKSHELWLAGKLEEAFGTGTAAVISPVGELKWGDKIMSINNGEIGPIAQKLYDTITGIQSGKVKDNHGWIFTL